MRCAVDMKSENIFYNSCTTSMRKMVINMQNPQEGRQRERERERERGGEEGRERERECVCVCVRERKR